MSESQETYDAGERLPDLTAKEVRAVTQWARQVKAEGRPMLLRRCPKEGEVVADPVSDTKRP